MKFIVVFICSVLLLAGVSLVWYRVTNSPRPQALTQVHDAVLATEIGKNIAESLGVSDESNVEPINVASVAGSAVSSIVGQVQQKAEEVATREVIIQVIKKIETLAPDEQERIKQEICK